MSQIPITSMECQHRPETESHTSRLMLPTGLPHLGHVHQNSPVSVNRTGGSHYGPHLEKRVDRGPVKIPVVQGPKIPVGLREGQEVPRERLGALEPG